MKADQWLVTNLSAALLALTIAGLFVRGRHRLCWSFLAYCIACLAGNQLTARWPGTFFTYEVWAIKEAVYHVLKVAIVVELGLKAFDAFPTARRQLLLALLAAAAIAAGGVLSPHETRDSYSVLLGIAAARNQAAMAALFAVVVALAGYYRIPLHPFHRGLLVGFALYLAVYTGALGLIRWKGWLAYPYTLALDRVSFAATVGVWAWVAWRRAGERASVVRQLQPWAEASR